MCIQQKLTGLQHKLIDKEKASYANVSEQEKLVCVYKWPSRETLNIIK